MSIPTIIKVETSIIFQYLFIKVIHLGIYHNFKHWGRIIRIVKVFFCTFVMKLVIATPIS